VDVVDDGHSELEVSIKFRKEKVLGFPLPFGQLMLCDLI